MIEQELEVELEVELESETSEDRPEKTVSELSGLFTRIDVSVRRTPALHPPKNRVDVPQVQENIISSKDLIEKIPRML